MQLGQLQTLERELGAGAARILLVNAYEDFDDRGSGREMRALLDARDIRWPVVDGTPALRQKFGNIVKIPAVFVYDRAGRLLASFRRPQRPPPTLAQLRDYLSPQ